MCGIVGMVGLAPVAVDLIAALARMEYRGYDSAGTALVGSAGEMTVRKIIGPASGILESLGEDVGTVGIAHTRWATHGRPELRNAHPFVSGAVAIVHNGIIENHAELRAKLSLKGYVFTSDTDSEVIVHLLDEARQTGLSPAEALRLACLSLDGQWAIAAVFADCPGVIAIAKSGSPLVVARTPGVFAAVGSDAASLGGYCAEFARLEDGDVGELTAAGVMITGPDKTERTLEWRPLVDIHADIGTGNYAHHTRREIAQQPESLANTALALDGLELPDLIVSATRLAFVACGSSLYAASAARGYVEKMTGIPCDLEVASEFRYREAPIVPGTVAVLVSQSGETADTMAALTLMRRLGVPTVAVVNVLESSIGTTADLVWRTDAGQETGVAATKTFTCQMMAIMRLGMAIAKARGYPDVIGIGADLKNVPLAVGEVEHAELAIKILAERIAAEQEVMFMGRGWGSWIAAEGALKLKELSYIPAAAYPAGELKHGPIALIREGTPVIVHLPTDDLFYKTLSNAEEVRARGAYVIAVTDAEGAARAAGVAAEVIVLPGSGAVAPFSHAVFVQLLSYHTAIALGRNVDRPRNLAKSVTTE